MSMWKLTISYFMLVTLLQDEGAKSSPCDVIRILFKPSYGCFQMLNRAPRPISQKLVEFPFKLKPKAADQQKQKK